MKMEYNFTVLAEEKEFSLELGNNPYDQYQIIRTIHDNMSVPHLNSGINIDFNFGEYSYNKVNVNNQDMLMEIMSFSRDIAPEDSDELEFLLGIFSSVKSLFEMKMSTTLYDTISKISFLFDTPKFYKTIIGFLGEMLFIDFCKEKGKFKEFMEGYHSNDFMLYDFYVLNKTFEVKSSFSTKNKNELRLKWDQTKNISVKDLYIVKVNLLFDDNGITIRDYLNNSKDYYKGNLIYSKCINLLRSNNQWLDKKISLKPEIWIYKNDNIPKINVFEEQYQSKIKEISYIVDISEIKKEDLVNILNS